MQQLSLSKGECCTTHTYCSTALCIVFALSNPPATVLMFNHHQNDFDNIVTWTYPPRGFCALPTQWLCCCTWSINKA